MEFGYELILTLMSLSTLTVIILTKVIYRHNPLHNEQYGREVVLFHSTDRYKRRVWRFNLIEELKKLKTKEKIPLMN